MAGCGGDDPIDTRTTGIDGPNDDAGLVDEPQGELDDAANSDDHATDDHHDETGDDHATDDGSG